MSIIKSKIAAKSSPQVRSTGEKMRLVSVRLCGTDELAYSHIATLSFFSLVELIDLFLGFDQIQELEECSQ